MRYCLFVTGTTGSGKSTLVSRLGGAGWVTFHTGDAFRRIFKELKDGDNPITPQRADNYMANSILEILDNASRHPRPTLAAIESYPRSPDQCETLRLLEDMGYLVHVLILDAQPSIRKARVEARDMYSQNRAKGDAAKMAGSLEKEQIVKTAQKCVEMGIPVQWESTDDWDYGAPETPCTQLELIQATCINMRTSIAGKRIVDADRMAVRAIEELQEFRTAISHAHQSEELVDALVFILNAFADIGMSAGKIAKLLHSKYNIVKFRQSTGTKPHAHHHVNTSGPNIRQCHTTGHTGSDSQEVQDSR